MPRAEWGAKHTCAGCDTKFYDMFRTPPSCPVCGTIPEVEESDAVAVVEDDGPDDGILDEDDGAQDLGTGGAVGDGDAGDDSSYED